MKTGACYIRVSTTEQLEYSPESQLRMIKDYAEKNDIVIPANFIYRDEGVSGRTVEKRPAFQEMVSSAKMKPRPFDVILIYSTSRFARNHEQSVVYRSMLERECGIDVVSITQPNVDKKTDMLTNAIYSIIDEWYSLDLSDNVKRGMTQKAMEGGYQTHPPLGYEQKFKGADLTIVEEEAEVVRYIFERFMNNESKWAIARSLKLKGIKTKRGGDISTRNIIYILRNPVYKGYVRWTPTKRVYWDFKNKDTIIAKGNHEAIIDENTFEEVQKKMDMAEAINKNKPRPIETTKHWLSGILKCSNCGQSLAYNGVYATKKTPSFRCGGYNRGTCMVMNFISVAEAEKTILDYLLKITNDIQILYTANISTLENNQDMSIQLEREIKILENKLERAKQGFLNGLFEMDEYRKIKIACNKEIDSINQKVHTLKKEKFNYPELQKKIVNIYNLLKNDLFSKNEKQIAARSLIEKIVVDKKSNEFRIYFYR